MSKIQILNPTPGGREWTSLSKARDYVRLGRARFEGERLRFLPVGFSARLADAEAEIEFRRNRGPRVYWNGAMGSDRCFPPGCNVAFRRPGS